MRRAPELLMMNSIVIAISFHFYMGRRLEAPVMIGRRLKVEGHGGLIRGVEEIPSVPTFPVHLTVLHVTKTKTLNQELAEKKTKTLRQLLRVKEPWRLE